MPTSTGARRRFGATVALLVSALLVASAGARDLGTGPESAASTQTTMPRLGHGALVVVPHAAAGPIGVDANHLVWESGPIESDAFQPLLHDRTLSTGATRTIAGNVNPLFGVASTSRFVFYAQGSGAQISLIEVSHRGGSRVTLTDALVAPIASRGDVVAWAEGLGAIQRVVAFDVARNKQWVVARMPRCTDAGCYRIDAVTVAERGVVFTRAAVGTQPSLVVRRAFGEQQVQSRAIAGDPQPDLIPSSAGALYYVLARGWYRWDFGNARPIQVTFANRPVKSLIRHEHGHWYWLVQRGCSFEVESALGAGGTAGPLVAQKELKGLAPGPGPACAQLGGSAWAGSQLLTSWAIAWEPSEAAHIDMGLRGVIFAGRRGG